MSIVFIGKKTLFLAFLIKPGQTKTKWYYTFITLDLHGSSPSKRSLRYSRNTMCFQTIYARIINFFIRAFPPFKELGKTDAY